MSTQVRPRYRLTLTFLLVALLCTACEAMGIGSSSTNPLLSLLAGVPQDPISQAEDYIYFVDYSALEAAYNVARPPSIEVFSKFDEYVEYRAWWTVIRESAWFLHQNWVGFTLETMPEKVGFSTLDVDQAIRFGSSLSTGIILSGSFDEDAISNAYEANLDFEPNDFDGETIWCWVEGCSGGEQSDTENIMLENPFGGRLGQRQPMTISDDLLMASPDLELVLAHLGAAEGTLPSLADDPAYRTAVIAISQDADILQVMIANEALVHGIANRIPIDLRYRPTTQLIDLNAYLEEYQELPLYNLLILADAVTNDEQIARLGIVYRDEKSAEMAASILLSRLESEQSAIDRIPFGEHLADRNVTSPRYYIHQEGGQVVLVLEFPTPKATFEELVQMGDLYRYEGTTTMPGFVYRLFLEHFLSDDTCWLSAATQADLETIRIGTVMGPKVAVEFSDIPDGVIAQEDFGSVFMVELDGGTRIKAIWNRKWGYQIDYGMTFVIVPTIDPDFWRVIGIVK
jgi:hypothetical protein